MEEHALFSISYATIDAALRVMHDVRDDRAGLIARYKYFQRNGFPEGTNAGRGKAVSYGIDQLLQLLLAFELQETGCGPTRVMRILRTNWPELRRAMALGWTATKDKRTARNRPLLIMRPGAFQEMGSSDEATLPVARPFEALPISNVDEWISGKGAGASRLLIDPMRVIGDLRDLFATKEFGDTLAELDDGFEEWWDDAMGHEPGLMRRIGRGAAETRAV